MRRTRFKGIVRDDGGTASLETLVLLPLIALCWAGVFFFFAGYEARITAATMARRDAWVTSDNACKDRSQSPDCSGEDSVPPPEDDDIRNVRHEPSKSDPGSGWIESATKVPFIGAIIGSVFGSTTVVTQTNTFDRPPLVGGGEVETEYQYRIACNVEPRSEQQIVEDVFCGMLRAIKMELFCGKGPEPPCP